MPEATMSEGEAAATGPQPSRAATTTTMATAVGTAAYNDFLGRSAGGRSMQGVAAP